ncbi:MAG: hypothetical protein RL441_1453 [Actinomycetota bacterium]
MSKQHSGSASVTALTFGALGVVFGDIGTSPIYALKESLTAAGTTVYDIMGVVSLLFWSLMAVVTFKYLVFVLRADNAGEGGILALFSLLPRRYRRPERKRDFTIFILMLLGTALLFGDGLITPAISVLSATEGLGAINPELGSLSVPITVLVLVILFSVQFKGTHSLGKVFGSVILLWFITIGAFGLLAALKQPQVFQALSPVYAIEYVAHDGLHTLIIMSSVILAVTGAEALYADLGHFGKRPIRLGWFAIVAPSLVLCYLGQAANMLENPENRENLFFSLAPNQLLKTYLVIVATLATVVASQALITGVASLARQASQLGLFPRLRVIHTSVDHQGQIYVPAVNAILGIGSIFLVMNFRTSSAMAHAYSFAIAGTMLVTTIAFGIVATTRWGWKKSSVYTFVAFFGLFDLAFFLATVTKVIHGAWVPLLIAIGVSYLMWVWRKGQVALSASLKRDRHSWAWLHDAVSSGAVIETESVGIFLSSDATNVPQAAVSQVQNLQAIPHRIIVVSVVGEDVPYSLNAPVVARIDHKVTHVSIFTGYMESPNVPQSLREVLLSREDEISATYYLSDRKFVGPHTGELRGSSDQVFSFLHRNSATASQYFGLPEDRVIILTVQMDL